MKYYRYLFIFILVLSANAHAFQPKIVIFEQFDNLNVVAFMTTADINNSPEWNPELGVPPLTVGEAIQAIKDLNKASKNSLTSLDIKEIEIRPIPKHEKYWHYLIKVANDAKKTKYNIYAVLMDGKVIPAIIEPQGYK